MGEFALSEEDLNKSRIIVIGANGLIGSEIVRYFKNESFIVVETSHNPAPHQIKIDLLEDVNYQKFTFNDSYQNIFIICSGYSNLYLCFHNREISKKINVDGMINLINHIKSIDGIPIFFSSDCVFDGAVGIYNELDHKNPISIYGKQKSIVEEFIVNHFNKYIILRSSKVLSTNPSSWIANTFISLENKLKVNCFTDRLYSPIVINDITKFISMALGKNKYGIFNLSQDMPLTPYQQAEILIDKFNFKRDLLGAITMDEIDLPEFAPKISILENEKAKSLVGFKFQCFYSFIELFEKKLIGGS